MKILQLLRDNASRTKQPTNLVRNSATEATIYIYDVIDGFWGVSAKSVIDALASVADVPTVHIRINSPGGDVFEGRAIVEAIKRFAGKTIAHVDSLAASAATGIAIAADEVEIATGAFFMIHNASAMVWGDKAAMRDTADLLEKVEGTIIADYIAKTGQDAAAITAWMDAETWFTAEEAVDAKLADSVVAGAPVEAHLDEEQAKRFKHPPKSLLARARDQHSASRVADMAARAQRYLRPTRSAAPQT